MANGVTGPDGQYTTNYGGTGTTISGDGWTYSSPDDPVAARAYLDSINKGRFTNGSAPAPGSGYTDSLIAGLSGDKRDAAVALTALFKSYGLESLAPKIIDYIKKGFSSDTISVLLQDTQEYKQRFAANEARKKIGLPVLSPAEYIATERSYRDVMHSAGLPSGFYDQSSDFEKFLAQDVSPSELKQRVDTAANVVNQADPSTLDYIKKFYTTGDIIAYALDPTRAAPLIEKQYQAAQVAGAASNQGVSVDKATAERLAALGVTQDAARQGFGTIGSELGTVNKLDSIYGGDVTQGDLVSAVFEDNANAKTKVKRLASKERASFSGSGGQSKSSLSKSDAGSI